MALRRGQARAFIPPKKTRSRPAAESPARSFVVTTSFVTDHVSRAADGVQQRLREPLVDLGAEPRDVHVDHIGLRIEVVIPDVFQKHGAGYHLPRMLHEIYQQPELARLQVELLAAAL